MSILISDFIVLCYFFKTICNKNTLDSMESRVCKYYVVMIIVRK